MSFKIIRNDITKVSADAIVNTANPLPVVGRGTDSAVYKAAGLEELLKARNKIGVIERGHSAWTESFKLKKNGIKYIIHTSGISYGKGNKGETEILRSCYSSSLNLAKELGCKTVAIPLLATGFYCFPKELGLQIAVDEISRFLIENDIDVILVVYDRKSYLISEKLFDDIQNFIDENGDGSYPPEEITCGLPDFVSENPPEVFNSSRIAAKPEHKKLFCFSSSKAEPECDYFYKNENQFQQAHKEIAPIDVDAFITQSKENLNFQNTLQKLIADRHLENSAVYTKALIDRKFFSKIISNKNYVPKKMTVMALGLALELKPEEFESFLASAGYAFMPSSKFDLIIKYCVLNGIYNLIKVDMILDSHGESCFSPE